MRYLAAAAVFVLLLARPAYIAWLRHHQPLDSATNGRFELLVPQLTGTRYHDEALYAARVRQVLLHGFPFNPYWRDDRGLGGWLHQSLTMYLLASLALPLGGNLTLTWIVAVALLGALWFLLFHAVFKWWSGRDAVAVPLALFSILFPDFYHWALDVNFNPAVNWHRWATGFFQHHSYIRPDFYRIPSNFLTSLILCVLLLGAWRLACGRRGDPARAAALGAGFGLLALVHAYTHVFGMATLAVMTLAVWVLRYPEATRRNLAIAFTAATAISLAYVGVMASVLDAQTRIDSLEWAGLMRSRRFYLITFVHVAAAGFGWLQYARETRDDRRLAWLLLIAAQLAGLACRNAQVAVGVLLQPFHFIPLASLMGCLLAFFWLARELGRRPWWSRAWGVGASLLIFGWAAANEKKSAESTYQLFGLPRDVEAALDWVRANAPVDSLVLSLSMQANKTLPLYTGVKVQVPPPDPNVSAPFSKDKYFFRLAQLLKTLQADPDRFLSERWLLFRPKNELIGRLNRGQNLMQRADFSDLEPAEWFYPQYAWDSSDAPIIAGRRRVKELYAAAPAVEPPYYVWLAAQDRHLLTKTPAALGARLVYENDSIQLYER